MKNNITGKSILIIILITLSVVFYKNTINEFPSHIHAWSQSDRYALAIGFEHNNLDFLHPETYNLNLQFPAKDTLDNPRGITAVDFPVHDYFAGIIMKISGSTQPWIFKLYSLILGCIGLFYLYKLSLLIGNSIEKSLFIVIFAFTAPVYTYYLCGFMPGTSSLACLFIGFYFYYRNILLKNYKDLITAIVLITISCMGRSSFLIFLFAIMGYELFAAIKTKSFQLKRWLVFLVSCILFLMYYFYNMYLRNKYGSVFLGSLMPAESITDIINIIKQINLKWKLHYFTKPHYYIVILIALTVIINKIFFKKKTDTSLSFFYVILTVMFAGSALFFIAMAKQFIQHDYYFIDTFFFPIIITVMVLLRLMPDFEGLKRKLFILILIFAAAIFVKQSYATQKERRQTGDWDRTNITIQNFKNSKRLLDSLNIPKTAKILVIDAYSPNIPFILMDRKGYAVLTTSAKNIKEALGWKYDYIVIQNCFMISDVIAGYPEITKCLQRIGGDKGLSVFEYAIQDKSVNAYELMGMKPGDILLKDNNDFEIKKANWVTNGIIDSINYFSEHKSVYLNENTEFGPTYSYEIEDNSLINAKYLFVEAYFRIADAFEEINIVFTVDEDNKNIIYKSINLKDYLLPDNTFRQIKSEFAIPASIQKGQTIKIYIWNNKRHKLWIDDIKFEIF